MNPTQRSHTTYSTIKTRQSLKNAIRKTFIAITTCIVNNSDKSKAPLSVKKQEKEVASSRKSKSKPSSLSSNVVQQKNVRSVNTINQHPHNTSSGNEHCQTKKEESFSNVSLKEDEPVNSVSHSSLQIKSRPHEQCQGSAVNNVNKSSQVQNHVTAASVMERKVRTSTAPSLKTTLSAKTPIDKCKKTSFSGSYQETRKSSSSSECAHVAPTTSYSKTSRSSETSTTSRRYSNEVFDDVFTSATPILNATPNQSAAESVPHADSFSYEKLGIITTPPQKPEFAIERERRKSFEGWPCEHHLNPEELAKAGFYYSGYGDATRCFYCSGGLRHWEEGDDVRVEHARWFPKCEFLRQTVGRAFIDAVQELHNEQKVITYDDVLIKLEAKGLRDSIPKDLNNKPELEQNTSVSDMPDASFPCKDDLEAAHHLQQDGHSFSYEEQAQQNTEPEDTTKNGIDFTDSQDLKMFKEEQETYKNLQKEIAELRQIGICKICMDRKVSAVFLPCGHLMSCQECSYALKSCPICRDDIRGVVMAYLS